MKRKLILFICLIALQSIAHTQRQYKSYAITNALDSISKEKRLVVLGVTQLNYLIIDNQKLCQENQALTKINERNELYIGQIERELRDIKDINKGLNEGLSEELKRKKKWRRATLYSVGLNITFLASLIVLNR
jgi:hypothetical protein